MTESEKNLDALLYSIEYSYLPKASKKVLVVLISAKHPLPIKGISEECNYSKPHVCSIIKRLEAQKLVKRKESNTIRFYTYTSECHKFLDIKQSIEFYQKKLKYKNI